MGFYYAVPTYQYQVDAIWQDKLQHGMSFDKSNLIYVCTSIVESVLCNYAPL